MLADIAGSKNIEAAGQTGFEAKNIEAGTHTHKTDPLEWWEPRGERGTHSGSPAGVRRAGGEAGEEAVDAIKAGEEAVDAIAESPSLSVATVTCVPSVSREGTKDGAPALRGR